MGTPMSEAIEQAKANLAPVGDAHENKPEPKKTPAKRHRDELFDNAEKHSPASRQQYLQ